MEEINNQLEKLTQSDWQNLFNLIPEIEKTKSFGEMNIPPKSKDGTSQFPYYKWAPVVSKFHKLIYEMGLIINFDWGKWNEGVLILETNTPNFNNLTIETLCKLITAIVRSDRFVEGNLICNFENGIILKIIKSLKYKIENDRK